MSYTLLRILRMSYRIYKKFRIIMHRTVDVELRMNMFNRGVC